MKSLYRHSLLLVSLAWASAPACTIARTPQGAADNADARAAATESRMTTAEQVVLTNGIMPMPNAPLGANLPKEAILGAGYVPGIGRLNIPALTETDGNLGVAWALGARGTEGATPLPSGPAMAATWNPDLIVKAGEMVGAEARAKGFNVVLAGGINLIRDPRGGRNFEYFSEDPLLSGTLGGALIAGIQSNHLISTVKHFAFNNQETARYFGDVRISEAAARQTELLAFELAIERGRPGAVMCAYNRVNGSPACGSRWLLNDVLKRDWKYPGFVMSDWGAVHSLEDALTGLDQQSAAELDTGRYFAEPLHQAATKNARYQDRLRDMNRRILRSIYANGLDSHPVSPGGTVDKAANAALSGEVAEQSIVLLRNHGNILPLTGAAKRILVLGGHADIGVLSGGGSSQTHLDGGPAATVPGGGKGMFNGWEQYQRSTPPLDAIRKRAGASVEVTFRTGYYIDEATHLAKNADVVILFANQWLTEGRDVPDIGLSRGQNELIAAVAGANPNTIVVLQSGAAVSMPWLDKTAGVIEAWYPGARGGEAIAAVLFGDVNPSGRLPITFPRDLTQLPRPMIDGFDIADPDLNGKAKPGQKVTIDYDVEGADIGYRWFDRAGHKALFPFGFGLSYTSFTYAGLRVEKDKAQVTVTNSGARKGAAVVQLYLRSRNGEARQRLLAFRRVELAPGESREVSLAIEPRLLADWDAGKWKIAPGDYLIAVGDNAETFGPSANMRLSGRQW